MIGHMILKKHVPNTASSSDGSLLLGSTNNSNSSAILGLKVVGGRILGTDSISSVMNPSVGGGRLGAIIEKVKKGSIADTIGRLKPGDEVLEWNGKSLKGKTQSEVADIIAESKGEEKVELLISRPTHKRVAQQELTQGQQGQPGHPHPPPLQSYPSLMSREEFISQNRIGRRHTDVIPGGTPPNPIDYGECDLFFRFFSVVWV